MRISKDKLGDYIDFLHKKRKGISAPQALLEYWNQVHEADIFIELNNLYQFWNLTQDQINEYESEFLQRFVTTNEPPNSEFIPTPPNISNPNQIHQIYTPPSQYYQPPTSSPRKKEPFRVVMIVFLILLVFSTIGYFAYNFYIDKSNESEEQLISNNKPKRNTNSSTQNKPVKDEVQKPQIDSSNVINEEDKQQKIRVIQDLLNAEENRDFTEIMRQFSPNIQLYWNFKNPTKDKMYELYESTWSKAIDITYDNVSIQRITNNVYEMTADYSYYSLKDETTKKIKVKNIYEFDKEGKIIKAYGNANK